MDAATVTALLQDHLEGCEFEVQGEGANYNITVIGDIFEGLRPVRRQQIVYAALADHIAEGSIHAVNISTFTLGQWQARTGA